uniref:Thioredoxin domain-containing protein n=1 Tax=Cyprinus carpio carpio TaxID=630221 RepID=A0A9J8AH11_CYPCA
ILFYFILFYFILFYFILFYFILFYFILFYFILFYFILFYFIQHYAAGAVVLRGVVAVCLRAAACRCVAGAAAPRRGSASVVRVTGGPQSSRWCGPCKILGPRLEKAIAKQEGRVSMAKVDIDEHTDLAIEYGVSAVPTVIAMRGGDVIDQFVGIKDEDQLDSFVQKLIG